MGPHFTVATPFAKQPNRTMRSKGDYAAWELEDLGEWPIPRTNYQRAKQVEDYVAGYPNWDGTPANQSWRLAWRRMADSSTVRTLHSAVIPPGPMHVHVVLTLTVQASSILL